MTPGNMSGHRLPCCIQLDVSDQHIFKPAAAPGEWLVSGVFMFDPDQVEALPSAERLAFAQGFLGIESFGWSTFATVSPLDPMTYEALRDQLAKNLSKRFTPPSWEAAVAAAQEELNFAEGICAEHQPGQLLAVERDLEDGKIVERFRAVARPRGLKHDQVWQLVPDEDA